MQQIKTTSKRTMFTIFIVILAAIALFTFPYAFNLTWSLPGANSDRTLTYTTGSLVWDSSASINPDGTICLSMFDKSYNNTKSQNGDNVVSPGNQNQTNIRLLNASGNEIEYSAVLYRLDSNNAPISASLTSSGEAQSTEDYILPPGVSQNQTIDAIGGKASASSAELMSVNWNWDYSKNQPTDEIDTQVGNDQDGQDVKYGVFIVVSEIEPEPTPRPDTNPDTDGSDSADNTTGADDSSSDGTGSSTGSSAGAGTGSSSTTGTSSSSSAKKVLPTTGDNTNMILLFACAIVAMFAMILLAQANRRSNKQEQAHAQALDSLSKGCEQTHRHEEDNIHKAR